MKTYKKVQVPATVREVLDTVTCDLCGKPIKSNKGFEVDEVTIQHRTGESYPECGSGEQVEVDMCGDCFDNKLMPWLRSNGVSPECTEWDW